VEYRQYTEISVRREISLGGETKYTINGSWATVERVKNFFRSVGLNVNNPNFLIMQGRITRVTYMKPEELLSLVSETSWLNTYEDGQRAVARLSKKVMLLKQIQNYCDNDFIPKFERAQKEKEEYDAWARKNDQLQTLAQRLTCRMYLDLSAQELPELLRDLCTKLNTLDLEVRHYKEAMCKHKDTVRRLVNKRTETKYEEEVLQMLKIYYIGLKARLYGHKEDLKSLSQEATKLAEELAKGREWRLARAQEAKSMELEADSASTKHRHLTEEVTDLYIKLAATRAGTSVHPVRELEHRIAMKNQDIDRKHHETLQITQQIDQCAEDIRKKEENLARTKAREPVSTEDLKAEMQQLEERIEQQMALTAAVRPAGSRSCGRNGLI